MKRFRAFIMQLSLTVLVFGFLPSSPALGNELDEIYRLADKKRYTQALKRLDAYLKSKPRDAQARFLKGLILTERKERDKAIQVFLDLSADYPDLPEPYNNLAVLYAEKGYYEKAQHALKQAVQTHPGYATAHENLGDIYAKMASQAYNRALRLNGDNPVVRAKLELVRKMFAYPPADEMKPPPEPKRAKKSRPARKQTAAVRKKSPPPPPAVEKKPPPAARPAPPKTEVAQTKKESRPAKKYLQPPQVERDSIIKEVVSTPPAPSDPILATPVIEPPPAASLADVGGPSSGELARAEVEKAVRDWALSWSSKDLVGYLGSYSKSFQVPPEYASRRAWEKRRRWIIGKAGTIRVTLLNLRINLLNENRAQATFDQKYWTRRYKDRVRKTLSLVREGGAWKIVREYADG